MDRSLRWRLGAGAAALLTMIGGWMLLRPHEEPAPPPGRPVAAAPAQSERAGEGSPASRREQPGRDAPAFEEPQGPDRSPEGRRRSYTRAFNKKIDRRMQRIAARCADPEFEASTLDDFNEVRDRIIESAIDAEQGRGLATKEEQRRFEESEMLAFDTRRCAEAERRSLPAECKRLFPRCDGGVAARR